MDETKQKACRIIGVALAALPLAACLAVLFTPRPAPANLWRESAVGGNGVSAIALSAPSYTASGVTAYTATSTNASAMWLVGGNTAGGVKIGIGGGIGAIWLNNNITTPGSTNYTVYGDGSTGALNTPTGGTVAMRVANANVVSATAALVTITKPIANTSVLFANLGTPADGTITYCGDCTFANPCAGSGTGAWAKRLAGAWRCD